MNEEMNNTQIHGAWNLPQTELQMGRDNGLKEGLKERVITASGVSRKGTRVF